MTGGYILSAKKLQGIDKKKKKIIADNVMSS